MSPTPVYQLRIQAIVVSPDMDASAPLDANAVAGLIAGVNKYFAQAGIALLFDPTKDYEIESSSSLATDDGSTGALQARGAFYQGKVVLFVRDGAGGLSGPGPYAICTGEIKSSTHELGHYFGLNHTHRDFWRLTRPLYVTEDDSFSYVEDLVATEVKSFNASSSQQLEQFIQQIIYSACDGDTADKNVPNPIDDTPPSVHEWPPNAKDASGKPLEECSDNAITFKINTVPGVTAEFSLNPDRTNLMSYFFSCEEATKFSPGQIDVMRSVVVTGRGGYDRRHLLGPALRWSGWYEVPGGGLTSASVAATDFGQLVVVAKGQGPGLFRNQATLDGTTLDWGSSWLELEGHGQTKFAPAATAFAERLYAFAVGPTGKVFYNFTDQGQGLSFQPAWFEVPGNGVASGAPSCTAFADKLYAFVIGPAGHIFHNLADLGQSFQSQWFEVPGNGVAQGTAASTIFNNRIYLFVTSPTGRIYHNFASAGQPFQPQWFEVPGNGTAITSPAAVAVGEYLYIFIVGGDHRLYMNWAKSGSPFGSWMEVPPGGGVTDQAPAVALWNAQLYLFGASQDNGRICVNSATPN
jgi:hypothetical protein